MRKLFGLLIKILPLITVYKGITSGGARLGPFVDTIKVALTQYEVAQITKLTYEDYGRQSRIVSSSEFPQFIKDNFHSQYSVLAREISGDKTHDHSRDIWGQGFHLIINQNIGQVRVASAGPDGIIKNKDDIGVDFPIEVAQERRVAKKIVVEEVQEVVPPVVEEPVEDHRVPASEYDEEGFDKDGFDADGFDRDGYDQNGNHRNDREYRLTDEEYSE